MPCAAAKKIEEPLDPTVARRLVARGVIAHELGASLKHVSYVLDNNPDLVPIMRAGLTRLYDRSAIPLIQAELQRIYGPSSSTGGRP